MASTRRLTRLRRTLALTTVLAALGILAPGPTSSTEGKNGLFRDQYGRLFCGAGCNETIKQVCCSFSIEQSPDAP